MIRFFLAFSLVFLTACGGCATSTKNLVHEGVTAVKMEAECNNPVEVHNVPPFRFPIPAQVSRHHGCQGVEDMLVVMWPLEASKANVTAAELLMLMYLDYENAQHPETVLTATFIKVDSVDHDGTSIQAAFYELHETPKVPETVEE